MSFEKGERARKARGRVVANSLETRVAPQHPTPHTPDPPSLSTDQVQPHLQQHVLNGEITRHASTLEDRSRLGLLVLLRLGFRVLRRLGEGESEISSLVGRDVGRGDPFSCVLVVFRERVLVVVESESGEGVSRVVGGSRGGRASFGGGLLLLGLLVIVVDDFLFLGSGGGVFGLGGGRAGGGRRSDDGDVVGRSGSSDVGSGRSLLSPGGSGWEGRRSVLGRGRRRLGGGGKRSVDGGSGRRRRSSG